MHQDGACARRDAHSRGVGGAVIVVEERLSTLQAVVGEVDEHRELGARAVGKSLETAESAARARKCGKCHHRAHGKQPCPVEGCCPEGGEALCTAVCGRCPHPPHKGTKCPLCKDVPARALCNAVCKLCGHAGSQKAHEKGW